MKQILTIFLLTKGFTLRLFSDDQGLEEKLDLVLTELDTEKTFDWDISEYIIHFLKFLGEIGLLFRILFYLLCTVLIIFIVYKTFTLFIKDSRADQRKLNAGSEPQKTQRQQNDYLQEARKWVQKGDYSEAGLRLHHGSFESLFHKKLLHRQRDYTNREIFGILKGRSELKPFKQIALEAELVMFRGVKLDEERYLQLESLFMEAFYV